MPRRLKVTDVNPHVVCTICDGYLVDATAIIECLHAFCRTCIVRYLENSKFCPVCDVQVHKTRPLLSIRSDQTLQDVVYKMVPGLYQNEMQRRREFYAEHPDASCGRSPEERGEGEPRFFSHKETISLSMQHIRSKEPKPDDHPETKDPTTRHLNCPAAFTIGHLKKFIHLKFSLPPTCAVDVFYDDHLLKDNFTLMDIAYIYSWKRAEPMKFFYSIAKRVMKYVDPSPPAEPPSVEERVVHDDVPEALPVLPATEPERIDVVSELSNPVIMEVDKTPQEDSKVDTREPVTDDIQKMDVAEPQVQSHSSLPPVKSPLVPEPTYNSVKVVSATETNPMLSPTNGIRLKFIHDPELNPKKSGSKKSGRKGGRSSRHKSAPVRLARLAPYPPPPVTCLTTAQHLPQLAMGKLVPSVITTLAPTFVTTLVSTTSNTLCSNSVSSFLGQSQAVCTLTTPDALLQPTVLPSTAAAAVSLSSTANAVNVAARPQGSTLQDSPTPTKELLPVYETAPDSEKQMLNKPSQSSLFDSSALTNSAADTHVPDSSISPSPKPSTATVRSPCRGADSSEIVTSTSVDVPVSTTVPIPYEDTDARGAFRETAEDTDEQVPQSQHSSVTEGKVSSVSSTFGLEDGGSTSTVVLDSTNVLEEQTFISTHGLEEKRQQSSKENKSSDSYSSVNGHQEGGEKSPKGSEDVKVSLPESFGAFRTHEDPKKSALEAMVKDSISAEFSDNDDLGCQPDLVVDERKVEDSSENEEEDAALRKKINAIAEKEDETDDTEADSGRASDMSCPARCEEDVGSPASTDPAPTSTTTASHHARSNNIDNVIKQLYLQHEIGKPASSPKPAPTQPQKDDQGALDLSTCTRKPGESSTVHGTRPRPVANPVLDIKHRQQTYLPAPVRQHTACAPAPKHPTSSPLLMHQLTSHSSILQAQLTGKAPHHPHHSLPYSPYAVGSNRSTPSYSYRFAQQQQGNLLAGMLPYPTVMAGYATRAPPPRLTSAGSHRKDVSASNKMASHSAALNSHVVGKNWSPTSSRKLSDALLTGSPPCRTPSGLPTSPTGIPAHPRASPSMPRMSPHHRSASPAPGSQGVPNSSSGLSLITSTAAMTTGGGKPSVPIYKKSDSLKGYNKFRRNANLAVFNPDPNGYRQKLVIKNLGSRSNSSNHHH